MLDQIKAAIVSTRRTSVRVRLAKRSNLLGMNPPRISARPSQDGWYRLPGSNGGPLDPQSEDGQRKRYSAPYISMT